MTVYGEFLFLENAVSGAVILVLTGRLCGSRIKVMPVLLGSIACGAYAFILMVPLSSGASLLFKLLFSVAEVTAVFRPEAVKALVRLVSCFYIVSFLMGGITIALMYMTGIQGITANGSVYVHNVTYLNIVMGISVTCAAGIWLSDLLKDKILSGDVLTDIEICICGKSWTFRTFVDTGNFLTDPVTGYPAVLMHPGFSDEIKKLPYDEMCRRICILPFTSVGKKGVLQGMRPDYIKIEGRKVEEVVIAVSDTCFKPWKGIHRYQALIGQQLYEGRNYADAE